MSVSTDSAAPNVASGTVRSTGWQVRPPFVPHGPTGPVTLLADQTTLSQVSEDPVVAWQTPWSVMSNIVLVRFARGIALFATIDGVRYCWRNTSRADFESLQSFVRGVGGQVQRAPRRAGAYALAAIVVLGAFAGSFAAWANRGASNAQVIKETRAVNLSLRDLPAGFSPISNSVLGYLFPTPGQLVTYNNATTTTAPKKNSAWAQIVAGFQRCLGVSNQRDRMYGLAGQMPEYQITSPVFASTSESGIEIASTTQYYATTQMVAQDSAEMRDKNFGSCFATSQAAIVMSAFGLAVPSTNIATSWTPVTFTRGFARGGVATIAVTGSTPVQLAVAVVTRGHYEITVGALVSSFKTADYFLSNVVNTLKAHGSLAPTAAV